MRYKKTTISIVIASILFVAAPASYATGDAAVLGPLIILTNTAVAAVGSAVTAGFSLTNQYLYRLENLLSANSAKVASQVAEAGQNQIERQMDMEKANRAVEVERATRMPIDPCANASRGLADPEFSSINPGFTGANGAPFGPRGMNSRGPSTGSSGLDKAIKIARNDDFAPPPEVQAVMAQRGACEAYASGGVRAQGCRWSGTEPSLSTGLPDADIRASTVFDGAQTAANNGKVSLSFDEKQLAATTAYVRNLSAPVQLRDLTKIESQTDEGRRYLALRDSYQARLDLAMRPVEEWTSNRTKYPATIPILKAMLEGDGAAAMYLQKHLRVTAPDWSSKGISLQHLMHIDAARRYDNPDWVKEVAGISDPITLQREQLMIDAQMVSLITKSLIESQKSNVLLGTIYQASLNKDFMPELAAQHRRAAATR